jgi:hypothetical protein
MASSVLASLLKGPSRAKDGRRRMRSAERLACPGRRALGGDGTYVPQRLPQRVLLTGELNADIGASG